jgi:hypothetical protein
MKNRIKAASLKFDILGLTVDQRSCMAADSRQALAITERSVTSSNALR